MAIVLTELEASKPGIGACVLLEYEGKRLLLDCGYDDSDASGGRPSFPVAAESIHAVVLSHGHLGHCGLLPILAREGFAGKVYGTAATGKIAILSMLETALLQNEERQFWVSKSQPERGTEPLYTDREVTACERFFVSCEYGEQVHVDEYATVELFRAGHCPGSSFVKVTVRQEDGKKKILYIGDMGARGHELHAESVVNDVSDHLILPAFRASRQEVGEVETRLGEIVNQAKAVGGNILIPVSSIDRRDAILKAIRNVWARKQMPGIFVFLDSPIAGRQCEAFPLETDGSESYLCLQPVETVSDSKGLNQIRGTAVIIAGSGRGGYGRIGFHLRKNLPRPETALVLFGPQTGSLLGQSLDEGRRTLSVQGQEVQIEARIHRLDDPTVHLDLDVVVEWLTHLKSMPRHVYVTHGTPENKTRFRTILKDAGAPNVHVPAAGGEISL